MGKFLVEHGRLGAKVFDYCGQDLEDARRMMEEQYLGEYKSLEDYAREYVDSCWNLPDDIESYFDYERFGRDLELSGNITTLEISFQEVHIFSEC